MVEWNFQNVGVTVLVLISLLLISLRMSIPVPVLARTNAVDISKAGMDVWILAGQSNMVGTNGKVWTHASLHDARAFA